MLGELHLSLKNCSQESIALKALLLAVDVKLLEKTELQALVPNELLDFFTVSSRVSKDDVSAVQETSNCNDTTFA